MGKLQIIIVSLLPFCFGQFSIQGPSDGNRRAQGLKYSAEKGVEYTNQAASLETRGFSIQGASDSNSDFQIQGATDGNNNFQIQGATDGNSEFQIHGPTDGGSQAYLYNYEFNEAAQEEPRPPVHRGRAIEYKDTNGHRVNWRSYNRATDTAPVQQQYTDKPGPVHLRTSHKWTQPQASTPRPQPQPSSSSSQSQYQTFMDNINYNPIEKAPPSIQKILQFQAEIPYVNIIPEHLRIDALSAAQAQAKKFAEEYPKQVLAQQQSAHLVVEEAPRSQYRSKPRQHPQSHEQRKQSRVRRQAPNYNNYKQDPQGQSAFLAHKGFRKVNKPPPELIPRYSVNVPQQIQEILRFQAQIPYDVIANQIVYRLEKPYVPQSVQHPAPQLVQAQSIFAQYKPKPDDYQHRYNLGQITANGQQQQQSSHVKRNPYSGNQQRSQLTPVTEEQY